MRSEPIGSIRISQNPEDGIVFRVNGKEIPYHNGHVKCTDSVAGRMLYVEDPEQTVRIYLVEHVISALGAAGLYNVIIDVDENCYAPTFSLMSRANGSILDPKIHSYCIPIPGPGIIGFSNSLDPHMSKDAKQEATRTVITCVSKKTYKITDPNPKYKGLERGMTIEPSESKKLEVCFLSSMHPDTKSIPKHDSITLSSDDDLLIHADARPVARVENKVKFWLLSFLNTWSHAITEETYFLATPGETPEGLVAKMRPKYQEGKNEHLYHSAVSDFISELVQKFGSSILRMKITLQDTNHRFRLQALDAISSQGAFDA